MQNGVAFGQLFHRNGSQQHETKPLPPLDLTGPAEALHRYWGAYLLCFEEGQGALVTRDPSGILPCYHGFWDGLFYAASDAALLFEASGKQPAIAWHSLGRSEERRVGKECVSSGKSRGARYTLKKKKTKI